MWNEFHVKQKKDMGSHIVAARGRRKNREMEDLPQKYAEAIDPCLSEEEDGETWQGEALELKNKADLQEKKYCYSS
ncbi:hypothetical protein J1N35_006467 [Gossypium stocksii]|uniref:Uncharacterized protein n=1 Tax=Gossypium stocksii TaxID=47602 RepID=A0A9D3WGK8_9ROSI|nr:hypothetical protein J1N35_006467 [Gossypium stocksii]